MAGLISVEDALAGLFALTRAPMTERVALRHAAGRVLAEDVVATRDQPPFAASAMDGYAIREADHKVGTRLRIVGEAAAGAAFSGAVAPGTAARIFTGAPVPAGAERVVLQEDVTRIGDTIRLGDRLEAGANIRAAGQDFRIGDRLAAPRRLRPADLALVAAMNLPEVTVARRPVVALMATGGELVMPGETPGPDQIIASNSFALAAMAEGEGAEVRMLPIARDNPASLRAAFDLAAGADLIVTIGGASVGDHDLVAPVAAELGMDQSFYKVAMRPGKPLMAGRLGTAAMVGLPGNPVSALVCGHVFLVPMLRAMLGLGAAPAPRRTAPLAEDIPANGPREHYMRATIEGGRIRLLPRQDSALLTILQRADALVVRPVGDPARTAGETVEYLPLRTA